MPAHTDPDQPGVWITLDQPFVMLGPNLVLDFDLGPAAGATSAPYNGDLITLSGNGKHMSSDPGCGGTLTASSTAGSFDLNLTGAVPSAPTWLILSTDATTWSGLPLPFMLDPIGMTGCLLGVDPQIVVAGTASAAGTTTLSVLIALPSDAVLIYAQAVHASAATPLGVATSNVTRSIFGVNGFCSYIYNFTVDGPVAQNGPYNWQGCMLLQ